MTGHTFCAIRSQSGAPLRRALLEAVALEDADFRKRRFDKVFAFNVAPFWLKPETALGVVRKHLVRHGTFYQVVEDDDVDARKSAASLPFRSRPSS